MPESLQEVTFRQPDVNLRLTSPGRVGGGLILPMHDYVQRFHYELGVGASHVVTVGVFDRDFDVIEGFIQEYGAGTLVTLNFGWRGGTMSRRLEGFVKYYTSNITPGGAQLEFEVHAPRASIGAARVRPGVLFEGQLKRNVGEAVRWVCLQLGMPRDKILITPTIPDCGEDVPPLDGSTNKTFVNWLTSDILGPDGPPVVAKDTDKHYGEYTFHFDMDGTFRFAPIELIGSEQLKMRLYDAYVYGYANDGRVLSLELADNRAMMAYAGGETAASSFVDLDDPTASEVVVDQESVGPSTVTEDGGLAPQLEAQNLARRFGAQSSSYIAESAASAQLSAEANWRLYSLHSYQMKMTIVGDPHIRTGDFIYIRVVRRDGVPHFLSGYYLVLTTTHDIDDSKFTTELFCVRRASKYGDLVKAGLLVSDALGETGDVTGEQLFSSIRTSPNYRFSLGTVFWDDDAYVFASPEGNQLEISPRLASKLPNYELPSEVEYAPSRYVPVEAEEE